MFCSNLYGDTKPDGGPGRCPRGRKRPDSCFCLECTNLNREFEPDEGHGGAPEGEGALHGTPCLDGTFAKVLRFLMTRAERVRGVPKGEGALTYDCSTTKTELT